MGIKVILHSKIILRLTVYTTLCNQTFNQAERHQWSCMENEWEKEKEKILNSLLGAGQETLDFSAEAEV